MENTEYPDSVFGLMVMGVFAEIRNGFECFYKCNIFCFQIWVNNSVVFWYSGMYVTKSSPDKS